MKHMWYAEIQRAVGLQKSKSNYETHSLFCFLIYFNVMFVFITFFFYTSVINSSFYLFSFLDEILSAININYDWYFLSEYVQVLPMITIFVRSGNNQVQKKFYFITLLFNW